jgi:hypothetical protein
MSNMVVSDDGDSIRITVHRSTWMMPAPIASIVRAKRAHYSTDPVADTAFLEGFLLAVELAREMAKAPTKNNSERHLP